MSHLPLDPKAKAFLEQDFIPAFINGKWTDCAAGTLDVIDPATGSAVTRVSTADASDVDKAVQAAHNAFPAMVSTERAGTRGDVAPIGRCDRR